MTQTFLDFDQRNPPRARNTDPVTSHLAATRAKMFRGRQALEVLNALKLYDGSTSAELADKSGLDRYMIAKRLADLRNVQQVYNPRKADGTLLQVFCSVSKMKAITWRPCQ